MCCTPLAGNTGRKTSPKNSPSANHRTIFSSCIFATKAYIDNWKKKLVKQQYLLHVSSQYGELWPTKIRTRVTPCVEVWQTSNLRPLRLGEKNKIDRKIEETTVQKFNGLPYKRSGVRVSYATTLIGIHRETSKRSQLIMAALCNGTTRRLRYRSKLRE